MTSLADRIAVLTNPAPEIVDPEDDINAETSAKLCKKDNEDDELIDQVSSLRSRNAPLLDEVDQRYAGKPISRKSVDGQNKSIDDFDSAVDDDDNDEENSDEQDDNFTIESFREQIRRNVVSDGNTADLKNSTLGDGGEDDDSEEVDDSFGEGHGDYNDNEDDSDTGGSEDEDNDESDDNMVQKFSNIDVNSEIKKGKAVELQQELWNRLCECRIHLQKLLLIANKLPRFDTWNTFKQHSDALYTENVNKGYKATQKLLMNLLDLQESIMTSDPELTMDISAAADDEEIPSDSGEEKDIPKSSVNKKTPRKRKLKDEDYRTILAKRHRSLIPYRNSVIQKWDEKTRLASGRMTQRLVNVQDQSALRQIEEKLTSNTGTRHYDPEIFDDSDFYGQLLKDIIECKSTGMDPAILNAQLEIRRVRSKVKKKQYDTKQTKGRKIKYIVHPKLLNFMAPAVTHGMPDMARDELFKSLFGQ